MEVHAVEGLAGNPALGEALRIAGVAHQVVADILQETEERDAIEHHAVLRIEVNDLLGLSVRLRVFVDVANDPINGCDGRHDSSSLRNSTRKIPSTFSVRSARRGGDGSCRARCSRRNSDMSLSTRRRLAANSWRRW